MWIGDQVFASHAMEQVNSEHKSTSADWVILLSPQFLSPRYCVDHSVGQGSSMATCSAASRPCALTPFAKRLSSTNEPRHGSVFAGAFSRQRGLPLHRTDASGNTREKGNGASLRAPFESTNSKPLPEPVTRLRSCKTRKVLFIDSPGPTCRLFHV